MHFQPSSAGLRSAPLVDLIPSHIHEPFLPPPDLPYIHISFAIPLSSDIHLPFQTNPLPLNSPFLRNSPSLTFTFPWKLPFPSKITFTFLLRLRPIDY